MTVIFHDLFEETVDTLLENHTPDTGTGWVILYDSFTVAVVHVKPAGHSGASNVVGPGTSDSGTGRAFKIAPAPSAAKLAQAQLPALCLATVIQVDDESVELKTLLT